ncbi:MAG: hypothetical protein ACI8P9_003487 [Parasphingorhabdus sp.]|jgi:hypothetical protein
MNKVVISFALVWGILVAGFVVNIATMETSISPGALANVANSPMAFLLLLLILLAFLLWLVPVLFIWLFFRRTKKSSV